MTVTKKKGHLLNYSIVFLFFVNIGPTLAKKIKTDQTDPTQYIKYTPINSFYLTPVTQAQVFALFAGVKDNKAFLNVPNKLIKLGSGTLFMPLCQNI